MGNNFVSIMYTKKDGYGIHDPLLYRSFMGGITLGKGMPS
ncbi:hypothetical protein JCM16163A_50110 [Paenibacillus sp. YK5]